MIWLDGWRGGQLSACCHCVCTLQLQPATFQHTTERNTGSLGCQHPGAAPVGGPRGVARPSCMPHSGKCRLVGLLGRDRGRRPRLEPGGRWLRRAEEAKMDKVARTQTTGKGLHMGSHHLEGGFTWLFYAHLLTNPPKHLPCADTRLGSGEIERGQVLVTWKGPAGASHLRGS